MGFVPTVEVVAYNFSFDDAVEIIYVSVIIDAHMQVH